MAEARDDAVRKLAGTDPTNVAEIARLQQEVGTLTLLLGDDKEVMSLKDYMVGEVVEFLQSQEESKNG